MKLVEFDSYSFDSYHRETGKCRVMVNPDLVTAVCENTGAGKAKSVICTANHNSWYVSETVDEVVARLEGGNN